MLAFCFVVFAFWLGASQATVFPEEQCGHVIRRNYNGVITSHSGFSVRPYPTDYSCLWRIQAPPLHRIRLFTPVMSVEYEPNCGFDRLDIYDDVNTSNRSRKLASLCGRERKDYIVSSGPYLTLLWTSDWTVTKRGFLARYDFVPNNAPLVRGGTVTRQRATCSSKEIKCDDGYCVPTKYQCDGVNDCQNKADEQNCPTLYPPTTTTTTTTAAPTQTTQSSAIPTNPTNPTQATQATTTGPTNAPPSGSCGVPPISPDLDPARVVGGKVAIPGSWPWTISLRLRGGHACGGSILTSRWIMTAAHCVEGYVDPSLWTIVAGLHESTKLDAKTQTIRVERIVVHPQWNSRATDYDYTLLYLAQPLRFTNEVQPICLPSRALGADVGCFVAGWGVTKGTGGEGFLKQAFVKTFSHSDCTGFYGGITDRMICAGHREGGKDTCQGDSGGPLMCQINGKWELHGATSFGGECAAANSPGVYARLSTVLTWIRQQIGV